MSISPDLAYQIEQQRLQHYRTVVEGAGKRNPPAEQQKVDYEAVAKALRNAWQPKKSGGSV